MSTIDLSSFAAQVMGRSAFDTSVVRPFSINRDKGLWDGPIAKLQKTKADIDAGTLTQNILEERLNSIIADLHTDRNIFKIAIVAGPGASGEAQHQSDYRQLIDLLMFDPSKLSGLRNLDFYKFDKFANRGINDDANIDVQIAGEQIVHFFYVLDGLLKLRAETPLARESMVEPLFNVAISKTRSLISELVSRLPDDLMDIVEANLRQTFGKFDDISEGLRIIASPRK